MCNLKQVFLIFPILCAAAGFAADVCKETEKHSGVISDSSSSGSSYENCWIMKVPEQHYTILNLTSFLYEIDYYKSIEGTCSNNYVLIRMRKQNLEYKICPEQSNLKPIIALHDVEVSYSHNGNFASTSFELYYKIESITCIEKSNFRCSNYSCIHHHQVCDGTKDCEDGADEIGCEARVVLMEGVKESRENAIDWLNNRTSAWGKDSQRAVTSLYLSKAENFHGYNFEEEEPIVKELELQTVVALLRNLTDPMSVSELSMFINALSVTCHNIRQFYGYNLLQILGERMATTKLLSPGAYLTLCSANWTYSESYIDSVMSLLHPIEYPFRLDIQAMILMTLTCIKAKSDMFENLTNASKIYNETIGRIIDGQLSDGSFGNVYTTALVTQALLSSGLELKKWNITSTVKYLIQQLNSSIDYLSAYLVLPILSGRSLVDIANVNCSNHRNQEGKISDVMNKLAGKISIQYSLFLGDQKDVIHTIYLKVPEKSSVYDVMRVAEMADSKYKFLQRDVSGHMYVYEIAGITNDPEAGKFWLVYTGNKGNGTVVHHTESPEKFLLADGEHLIMWYKTFRLVIEDEYYTRD